MRILLVLLPACTDAVPQSCIAMCRDGASLYGGCIEDWGLDWPAVGYEDRAAFLLSCETWAWQAEQLTRDQPDWVETTCDRRQADFASPEATCETFTGVDWNVLGDAP